MELVEIGNHTNGDALDLLNEMIDRVKSGEISCVSVAYVSKTGTIGGDTSSGNNKLLIWAAMQHVERSFYTDQILEEDET